MTRRRRAIVHPRGVAVRQHPEIEPAAATRDVFNQHVGIAPPQFVEKTVKRYDVRVVAFVNTVAVVGPIAVQPEIVVPLQIIGMHAVEKIDNAAEHPLPRLVRSQAQLRAGRVTI